MYSEDEFLQLSGIQHFMFCRRQWALIHVEQQWEDNLLTASGIVEHKRVHDSSVRDVRDGKITIRGLKVKSHELGVSGECDAVEFSPSTDGITLFRKEGLWDVAPVEYKHGKTKVNDCDRLQATLQAMCLEEMFTCQISHAYIFYHETRRREYIELSIELRANAKKIVEEMHSYLQNGYTPKVKPGHFCNNCSLKTICMPELLKKRESVTEYIKHNIEVRDHEENA